MLPNARFRPRNTNIRQTSYQPLQIKNAYGISKVTATGKNQKIAIVVAYGSKTITNDLTSFDNKYDSGAANLQTFYPEGTPATSDSGWAEETSLDVEWSHALAPNATIDLVVAKSDSSSDLLAAVDYASNLDVQVVSMSWGTSESSKEVSLDSHFQHPGTVYVAASGDNGAGVEWPAASPNVLAVGGTTLPLDSQGNITKNETAWSSSGGGISRFEAEPSYQQSLNINSNNHRAVPDVAFDADPTTGVMVNYNSTWYIVGGTSFAAPAWSAFIALVDENRTAPLSNVQTPLYSLASGSTYSSDFRDITIGSNGRSQNDSAKKGYDLVTGLGTPLENDLITNLSAK
jgi:subtilase family serine protease